MKLLKKMVTISTNANKNDAIALRCINADLFALAEEVVKWYENYGNVDPDQKSEGSAELWSKARAAIAKAKS